MSEQPPVLGYRDGKDDAPEPQRATVGHIIIASLGAALYFLLLMFFASIAVMFARQNVGGASVITGGIAVICGFRTFAAIKVLTDHLMSRRSR